MWNTNFLRGIKWWTLVSWLKLEYISDSNKYHIWYLNLRDLMTGLTPWEYLLNNLVPLWKIKPFKRKACSPELLPLILPLSLYLLPLPHNFAFPPIKGRLCSLVVPCLLSTSAMAIWISLVCKMYVKMTMCPFWSKAKNGLTGFYVLFHLCIAIYSMSL